MLARAGNLSRCIWSDRVGRGLGQRVIVSLLSLFNRSSTVTRNLARSYSAIALVVDEQVDESGPFWKTGEVEENSVLMESRFLWKGRVLWKSRSGNTVVTLSDCL
jgi:hypothetical protein